MAANIFEFTVPAATLASKPASKVLEIFQDTVKRAIARFPDRCAGQVGVRLTSQGVQIAPQIIGTWEVGNDEAIILAENFTLDGPAYRVILYGFNVDPVYPHTVSIKLEV